LSLPLAPNHHINTRLQSKRNLLYAGLCLSLIVSLCGCHTVQTRKVRIMPPPQGIPGYRQVAQRYNKHLKNLDQLWTRVSIDAVTFDHKGDEQGLDTDDALIMTIPPNKLLLRISKLGQDIMWAGYNEQLYWLFDVYENDIAYVGRHANLGMPGTRRLNLPAHLQPMDLPHLLGLIKIDENRITQFDPKNPRVKWSYEVGAIVIEPPGTGTRFYIEPRTYMPVQIELLGPTGNPFMTAKLSKPERVDLHEQNDASWPTLQTQIDITHARAKDRISLTLWNMNDGRQRRGIKKAQFNFQALRSLFDPAKIEDLDKPAAMPQPNP
jgi:hypothetical protein